MAETATWVQVGDLRYLRFPWLESAVPVRAVFTGRHGGVSGPPFSGEPGGLNLSYSVGDDPAAVLANRRRALGLIDAKPGQTVVAGLVHGTAVLRVSAPLLQRGVGERLGDDTGLAAGVDALVTDACGLALLVTCADCVPVLLADPVRRCIGLAHAGWRGTAARIANVTVAAMAREFGTDPGDIRAVVGPGIGPCCFEVDAPVASAMTTLPGSPTWLIPGRRPGHWQLDLWAANRDQLCAAGVPVAQVRCAALCTACQVHSLFSHRAERGQAGRQAAILMLESGRPLHLSPERGWRNDVAG